MSDLFFVTSKLGVSSLFRVVLPGPVWALLLLPLANPLVPAILRIDEIIDLAAILLPEALILGLFASLFRSIVYRIYEGRLLWPQWLHRRLTRRLNIRVRKQLGETERLDASSVRYKELWYWLRMFPLDRNGDPTARRPTILGNVLEGYEEYPLRRYGMDPIFYWYRLLPNLPEDFVKQMDQLWAEADCLMYSSFAGLVVALVYTILAIAKWVVPSVIGRRVTASVSVLASLDLIPGWGTPLEWAIGCLIGGYLAYQISLPLHRRNGEYFKAAFDLYRGSITEITKISPKEKEIWRKTWSYLQYLYIQCARCEKYYYAEAGQCPYCESKKDLERRPSSLIRRALAHLFALFRS